MSTPLNKDPHFAHVTGCACDNAHILADKFQASCTMSIGCKATVSPGQMTAYNLHCLQYDGLISYAHLNDIHLTLYIFRVFPGCFNSNFCTRFQLNFNNRHSSSGKTISIGQVHLGWKVSCSKIWETVWEEREKKI